MMWLGHWETTIVVKDKRFENLVRQGSTLVEFLLVHDIETELLLESSLVTVVNALKIKQNTKA